MFKLTLHLLKGWVVQLEQLFEGSLVCLHYFCEQIEEVTALANVVLQLIHLVPVKHVPKCPFLDKPGMMGPLQSRNILLTLLHPIVYLLIEELGVPDLQEHGKVVPEPVALVPIVDSEDQRVQVIRR